MSCVAFVGNHQQLARAKANCMAAGLMAETVGEIVWRQHPGFSIGSTRELGGKRTWSIRKAIFLSAFRL
jgi:hypothetical protein